MWECYLCDTMTGLLRAPIDVPAFSWAVSVSDSSLATTKDKGTGEGEASSITVPWSAVPATDAASRSSLLSAGRRGLALLWRTEEDGDALGVPVLFGAIGQRSDTERDTSFSLDSALSLLDGRIAVREGDYGAAGGHTRADLSLSGLSYRGIASELGWLCTDQKPGGALPVDWTYRGERGTRERTYRGYDCANNSCRALLENLANVQDGPDMQLRPYLSDARHVRLRFLAGSDADVCLGQDATHRLSWPGGIEDLTVDHLGPVARVYGAGGGSEEEKVACLAEDLALQQTRDPYPLVEAVLSSADDETVELLASHAEARRASRALPVIQVKGRVDATDQPVIGRMWPGEVVELATDGYPTLPDGVHRLRLMQMEGDEGASVRLTFDVCPDPIY